LRCHESSIAGAAAATTPITLQAGKYVFIHVPIPVSNAVAERNQIASIDPAARSTDG
jgi:hypothetical protein